MHFSKVYIGRCSNLEHRKKITPGSTFSIIFGVLRFKIVENNCIYLRLKLNSGVLAEFFVVSVTSPSHSSLDSICANAAIQQKAASG